MIISPGDESRIKSATFTVTGDYAFVCSPAKSACIALVRISPFDQASAVIPRSATCCIAGN